MPSDLRCQEGPGHVAALTDRWPSSSSASSTARPSARAAWRRRRDAGKTRREHVDALAKILLKKQADAWSTMFKTPVPQSFWSRGISCLSAESIALAHLFHDMGARVWVTRRTPPTYTWPMRIAFERGAARQYAAAGSTTQRQLRRFLQLFHSEPTVPRGAKSWFHSRYAVTDGVSASWYRKLYYLNYLSGADAIYWEQNLGNQWMLPGRALIRFNCRPSPATEDFQALSAAARSRRADHAGRAPSEPRSRLRPRPTTAARCSTCSPKAPTISSSRAVQRLLASVVVLEGMPASSDCKACPARLRQYLRRARGSAGRARAILNYPVVWAAAIRT